MESYAIATLVGPNGEIPITKTPFSAGTQVDVMVVPKRTSHEAYLASWRQVVAQMRNEIGENEMSEEEIDAEIRAYRAGK